jgi:ubiquinone biosynthesis protein COQ9
VLYLQDIWAHKLHMTEDQPTDHLAPIRRKLLVSALENVPFDGWSEATLRRAAEENDIAEGMALLAFPTIRDLVVYFIDSVDRDMLAALSTMDLDTMRIRDRITAAIRARIEALGPYRESERRAVAFMALPQNVTTSMQSVLSTVDLMWRAIGDQSTDFNYYSKRATLAGVLSSTILYWLADLSEDYEDTWAFLDRRIEGVMKIEKAKGRLRKLSGNIESPSILGMLSRLRYGAANRMKD